MEVERQMYMMIADKMSTVAPHLAKGIAAGVCDEDYLQSNSAMPKKIFSDWQKLYAKVLRDNQPLTAKCADVSRKGKKIVPADVPKVHFVISELLQKVNVWKFIDDQLYKPCGSKWQVELVAQVAQTLCAMQKFGVMHHDLHLGNIFVRVRRPKREWHYTTPFKFTLKTAIEVKLYDYDQGRANGLPKNTFLHDACQERGQCNRYVENWDWYQFLYHFLNYLVDQKIAPDASIVDLIPCRISQDDAVDGTLGQDAFYGMPCECVQARRIDKKTKECAKCVLRSRVLKEMMSPREWLRVYIK